MSESKANKGKKSDIDAELEGLIEADEEVVEERHRGDVIGLFILCN